MEYALGALAAIGLLNTLLLVRVARSLGSIGRLEARAARLTDALGLLTDTTESGFRAVSERLPGERKPQSRARRASPGGPGGTATARMLRSAQRGRSAAEIAAREEVAEGEVRLRLHLAEASVPDIPESATDDTAA